MKSELSWLFALSFGSLCLIETGAILVPVLSKAADKVEKSFNVSDNPNDVQFYLYSNPKNYALKAGQLLDVNNLTTIRSANFIPGAPVKFITHGFVHNYTCWVPQQMKDTYFERNVSANIIAVDWGKLAAATSDSPIVGTYPFAVENVNITGKRVADLIQLLVKERNISLKQIHLIGFSLGAHVSGVAGGAVQKIFNQRVGRITGLDPAGPAFYTGIVARQLKKTDADFVDVVHTSMGQEGIAEHVGNVDFFLNALGFAPQPGCDLANVTCSHDFSPNVFMQSIGRTDVCGCSSKVYLDRGLSCSCGAQDTVVFGDNTKPKNPLSSYYLNMTQVPISLKYTC